MESRPELTTADYVVARLERARYDTTGMQQLKDIRARYDSENDAFIRAKTATQVSKPAIAWFVIRNIRSLILIVSLLRKAHAMQNMKTTISAVIGALVLVARIFGLEIPPIVSDGLLATSLFLVGLFAKDQDTTQKP